ncbi:MAG: hypothetical protein KDB01_25105 [Planctomycetaceae bacterium]|nr:hypothetical protein [Planctomycetaceae bacterium]
MVRRIEGSTRFFTRSVVVLGMKRREDLNVDVAFSIATFTVAGVVPSLSVSMRQMRVDSSAFTHWTPLSNRTGGFNGHGVADEQKFMLCAPAWRRFEGSLKKSDITMRTTAAMEGFDVTAVNEAGEYELRKVLPIRTPVAKERM